MQNFKALAQELPKFPDFKQVRYAEISKPDMATVTYYYKSPTGFASVKEFYRKDGARLSPRPRITYPATQPYESVDSAEEITILTSGKATTRVKRRITAAFEGTDLHSASPRGQQRGNSTAPLKLAEA